MAGDTDSINDLLKAAVEAASRRDVRGYVINLTSSHVLDSIMRNLEGKWPHVDSSEIEVVVAEAADVFYDKLAAGVTVRVPAGFLWRTAHNKLLKRHDAGLLIRESFDESMEDHNRGVDNDADEPDREAMRAQAVRFARSVLPSLGQTVVVQVMTFIIDCVEQGELYVDNKFIADALGLSSQTVRRAKHRGFQRLAREARRRGIEIDEELANTSEGARELEED
ncbi:MAG: hypothetical protein ACREXU_10470 [Gammaproteobacteria bacterium]